MKGLWVFPFLCLSALGSDLGLIIFGGEGPDGPLSTVSVLTENGWCPQENILLPPLPVAASNLKAFHGIETNLRPYIVVCGFPGDIPCYETTLSFPTWRAVGLYDKTIDMSELEFVDMYENYKAGALTSMWKNKTSGMFDFLWTPGQLDPDSGEMVGWMRDDIPSINIEALGADPDLCCVEQPVFPGGYPYMTTISGGFYEGHSLDQMLIMDSHLKDFPDGWEWKNNSRSLHEPRSGHACLKINFLGTKGLLVAGGFAVNEDAEEASTLSSLEFFFGDDDNLSDLPNAFEGLQSMSQPRANFGLVSWGEDALVAVGGKTYDGHYPDYKLLDSVEIWDKTEDVWSVREEWKLETPRADFGIATRGFNDGIVASDYCSFGKV